MFRPKSKSVLRYVRMDVTILSMFLGQYSLLLQYGKLEKLVTYIKRDYSNYKNVKFLLNWSPHPRDAVGCSS